jgi:hypothetical protein
MVSADGSLDSARDLLLSRKPSPERDADGRQRITHRVVLAARRTPTAPAHLNTLYADFGRIGTDQAERAIVGSLAIEARSGAIRGSYRA